MALTKGTNCGFVTTAPTSDPAGTDNTIDAFSRGLKDTTPAGTTKITEIGWYCDNATEETNFEVGIYLHDTTNNKPLTPVTIYNTNAKGTDAGWKSIAVDINVDASTIYWIAIQVDNTATATNSNYASSAGNRCSRVDGTSGLLNPWGTSAETEILYAIYAVCTSAAFPTIFINVVDIWKEIERVNQPFYTGLFINVGDAWKNVDGVFINVGDIWKSSLSVDDI